MNAEKLAAKMIRTIWPGEPDDQMALDVPLLLPYAAAIIKARAALRLSLSALDTTGAVDAAVQLAVHGWGALAALDALLGPVE